MVKKVVSLFAAMFTALALCCVTAFADEDYSASLADQRGELSEYQAGELFRLMQRTAEEIHANVGVVLPPSVGSGNEINYCESFLEQSFGRNDNSVVLMLIEDGTGEQDWIDTTGSTARSLYGNRTDIILDSVYSSFDGLDSDGGNNYYAAIDKFCSTLSSVYNRPEDFETNSEYGASFESHNIEFSLNLGTVVGLIIAAVIAIIVVSSMAAHYKKRTPISARAYIVNNMTHFTRRNDVFIREFTTSHRIDDDHQGGGGHHGGGGGGHSSSGHSGGGGRHR